MSLSHVLVGFDIEPARYVQAEQYGAVHTAPEQDRFGQREQLFGPGSSLLVDVHNSCFVVAHHQDMTVLHLPLECDQRLSDRFQLQPVDGKRPPLRRPYA